MSVLITRVYDKLNDDNEHDHESHIISIIANDDSAIYLGKISNENITIYQNSFDKKISNLAKDLLPNSSQNWTDLAYLLLKDLINNKLYIDTINQDIDINVAIKLEQQLLDNDTEMATDAVNDKSKNEENYILKIAELTNDIKKIQADYINYKKRVEKNSELVVQNITTELMLSIIPLLDDIFRIEKSNNDPIVKSFKLHLESILRKYNVNIYTDENSIFDPNRHEALHVVINENFNEPTITNVFQPGYIINGKVIKAAQVEVTQQNK
jgi:molecular chaperone GrpE (heat shock protein)